MDPERHKTEDQIRQSFVDVDDEDKDGWDLFGYGEIKKMKKNSAYLAIPCYNKDRIDGVAHSDTSASDKKQLAKKKTFCKEAYNGNKYNAWKEARLYVMGTEFEQTRQYIYDSNKSKKSKQT